MKKLNEIAISLTSYDYDSLVKKLNDLLTTLAVDIQRIGNLPNAFIQNNNSDFNYLYRVRPNANNFKEPWGNLSCISYIQTKDVDKIKDFGRVNKPAQSMFYCSTEWHTAVYEMLPRDLNRIPNTVQEFWYTMGTWRLESDLVLADIPKSVTGLIKLMAALPELKISHIALTQAKSSIERLQNRINNNEAFDVLMYFADQFAKSDVRNKKEYMLSNYFADRAYGRIDGFNKPLEELDGIIYPSVPSSYKFSNIVMEPAVVKSKLKFMWADRVIFRILENESWELINGNQMIHSNEDGNFSWDF